MCPPPSPPPFTGQSGSEKEDEITSLMSSPSATFWTKNFFEGSLRATLSRFWSWYRTEFFALFSPATVAWMLDRGDRKLIIDEDDPRLADSADDPRLADSATDGSAIRIGPEELKSATLANVLSRRGLSREATKIVLQISPDKFFVRRFDIPAAARANLPRLLEAEIERKTPFSLLDIFFGHVLAPSDANAEKLHVEQWILRRDIVERTLEGVGLSVSEIDVVQPAAETADSGVPEIMVGHKADVLDRFRMAAVVLSILAILLFLAGFAITMWRQSQLASQLDAAIAASSQRAAQVRQMADQATGESFLLAHLRHERENLPPVLDLWEEISRVLPDGAYLTELRVSEPKPGERVIDLTGFSDAAADLPALFDRSPLFFDASLTDAITPDLNEKRERFSLQIKVAHKSGAKSK